MTNPFAEILSPATVKLRQMVRLVRLLARLSLQPAYRSAITAQSPAIAGFDPGHHAVMMGYDFHLTPMGPRLIEVNTNAGGFLPAWLAGHPGVPWPNRLADQLFSTFAEEARAQSRGALTRPRRVAILDDAPLQQFLYPEMQAFADLFRRRGVAERAGWKAWAASRPPPAAAACRRCGPACPGRRPAPSRR